MMKYSRRVAVGTALGLLAIATGCKTDLTAPNLNNPDLVKVLGTGTDVQNVIGNAFATWWNAEQNVNKLAMAVNADEVSGNYGNFGMRFNGQEPRIAYNNAPGSGDLETVRAVYNGYYSALGSVNDGLKAIGAGVMIGNAATTEQYVTFARFLQGAAYSSLGMYFDQAFVVDEKSEVATLALQPYAALRDAALAKFDGVITATAGKTYTFPAAYVEDLPLTAANLGRLANSLAARTLVLSARTGAANTATNWARVLGYASKGISSGTPFDLALSVSSTNAFRNFYTAYANTASWTRVDMRVIQAMDSTQPNKLTSTVAPPRATSADDRLNKDFLYNATLLGDPTRGVWFLSNWSHQRYLYMARGQPLQFLGLTPSMRAAENDLMWAEALVRTGGDKNLAATLINNTRVTRGKLSPATGAMSTDVLLSLIRYERLIDLYATNVYTSWGDARRFETLPPLAARSMPLPATELQTLGLPVYTFGGAGNPQGR
ncbi:MAG: RagB/SusD family nutrient uptake outer membrane protein [Gemmatimonadota bacterium]